MRPRTRLATGAVAALTLLAGCAATPPPPITTIGELGAAYLDAGGECADLTEQYRASDDEPVVAACGADTELILAADADEAQAVATQRQLQEQTVLVFDRWVIRDPDLETLQQELGGQIVTLAPAEGPANMADAIAFDDEGVVETDPVPADGVPAGLPDASDVPDVLVVVDAGCEYCDRLLGASGDLLASLADDGRARVSYLPVSLGDSIENRYASTLGANALACVADAAPDGYRAFQTALLAQLQQQPFDAAAVSALASEHVPDGAGADVDACVGDARFAWWVRKATVRAIEQPLQGVEPLRGVPSVFVDGRLYAGDVSDQAALEAFIAQPTAP